MTGGELRELARDLGDAVEGLERVCDALDRLADEQEAAQAAPSEPEGGAKYLVGASAGEEVKTPRASSGSLDAEADAALIREAIWTDVPIEVAERADAALARLLAGKAAG